MIARNIPETLQQSSLTHYNTQELCVGFNYPNTAEMEAVYRITITQTNKYIRL